MNLLCWFFLWGGYGPPAANGSAHKREQPNKANEILYGGRRQTKVAQLMIGEMKLIEWLIEWNEINNEINEWKTINQQAGPQAQRGKLSSLPLPLSARSSAVKRKKKEEEMGRKPFNSSILNQSSCCSINKSKNQKFFSLLIGLLDWWDWLNFIKYYNSMLKRKELINSERVL